jgi:hypothetical protein
VASPSTLSGRPFSISKLASATEICVRSHRENDALRLILLRERDRASQTDHFDIIKTVTANAAISPFLPVLFILAVAVGFIGDLLFGRQNPGVAGIYTNGNMAMRPELSLAVLWGYAVVVGTTYLLLRALQSQAAMAWIVWPRIRAAVAARPAHTTLGRHTDG